MYNNIPKLQTGAYIPGLSSSIFQAGLSRDIAKTQGDLRSLGRNIKRKQKSSKLFGSLGKLLGKGGMKFLTKGLMASNPLLGLALNAAGSAGGKYLGAKLGYGKKSKIDNDSELLGSQFKDLSDFESGISKEIAGESVADFGTEFAKGLKSEYGQNIMDSLKAKKDEKLTEKAYAVAESQGEDVFDVIDGIPHKLTSDGYLEPIEMKGVLSESMPTMADTSNFDKNVRDYFQSKPLTSYMDTKKVSQPSPSLVPRQPVDTSLMDSYFQSQLFNNEPEQNNPSVQNALLGLSNTVSQYNMPGMAHGGYVPEKGFGGLIQYRKGY